MLPETLPECIELTLANKLQRDRERELRVEGKGKGELEIPSENSRKWGEN